MYSCIFICKKFFSKNLFITFMIKVDVVHNYEIIQNTQIIQVISNLLNKFKIMLIILKAI